MANYEQTRYDFDGAFLTDVQGVNTGLIIPWSSATVPDGFLECNGTAVSRSTYSALFAVVGTSYGVGDGSTTFNVPDLTDRTCVHQSPTKSMFSTGGANTVSGTGNISGSAGNTTLSTPTIATHNHPASLTPGNLSQVQFMVRAGPNPPRPANSRDLASPSTSAGGGGAHDHPFSGTFTGAADSVLQPYVTIKYIIKT